MFLINKSSHAAQTALIYITVGALALVWTAIWALYLVNNPPEAAGVYYICGGFAATGLTMMLIGMGLGRIGKAAANAETSQLIPTQPQAVVVPTQTLTDNHHEIPNPASGAALSGAGEPR